MYKLIFQPYIFTSTPKHIKESDKVSKRTLKNRQIVLTNTLNVTAGSSSAAHVKQTGELIKSFDEINRQEILKLANISAAEITAEEMVALKADMGVPWTKLKTMSR